MKLLGLVILVFSTTAIAKPKIGQIFDGEFNMDRASCWLENNKSKAMLYQIDDDVKIKIDAKIITLAPKDSNKIAKTYECGKSYFYSSTQDGIEVEINMSKKNSKGCKANLLVSAPNGSRKLKGLKLVCGE